MRTVAASVAVALLAAACSGTTPGPAEPDPASSAATPTRAAEPPPDPPAGRCYQLDFDDALAPAQPDADPRRCRRPHTSETFRVAQLDLVVDGHHLAVDAPQVQQQAAQRCTERLPGLLGAGADGVRLSMVQPIWFTPTLDEADAGARWLRCDAVVITGDERLARRSGSLRGALADGVPERLAMCGTAAPDADDFERVVCAAEHTWRAVSVVEFVAERDYPGARAARERGRGTCEEVGADAAADPLDYRWSYEWPTKEQWGNGMRFGRCWVPD